MADLTPEQRERLAMAMDGVVEDGIDLRDAVAALTTVVADLLAEARAEERERFRSHALLNDDNMRALHENAKAYSLANTALRETFGYSHSTTLAFLIKQRCIGPAHVFREEALNEVADAIDPSGFGWSTIRDAERVQRALRARADREATR